METEYLALTWSTSRAADTYGYNICTLTRDNGLKRDGNKWQCNGGGYDMTGTVFAGYLEQVHQGRLMAIAERAGAHYVQGFNPARYPDTRDSSLLYGMTAYYDKEAQPGAPILYKVVLDGACGINSIVRIAEAIGLRVDRTSDRKGHTTGFYVFIDAAPGAAAVER